MRHAFLLNACTRPQALLLEFSPPGVCKIYEHLRCKNISVLGHSYSSERNSSQANRRLDPSSRSSSAKKDPAKSPAFRRQLRAPRASHARRSFKLASTVRREVKAVRIPQLSPFARMKSHLQFVTTPTSDTPGTALILHFDDKRYLFGHLHEGLQRAGLQSGVRFLKAKDVFLTGRTEWSNTGGMLGMILTLADAAISAAASRAETVRLKLLRQKHREEIEAQSRRKKVGQKRDSDGSSQKNFHKGAALMEEDPTLRIHGGPNLAHTLATARSFIFRQGLPLEVSEFDEEEGMSGEENDWEPTFVDNRIRLWAMPVRPTGGGGVNTAPRPVSPRKRSLGEYMSDDKNLKTAMNGQRPTAEDVGNQWGLQPQQPKGHIEQDQQLRQTVVTEMFKSKWRYDKLVEMPIHEVTLPAALFVRDAETNKLAPYEGPIPSGTDPVPNINVLVRQPWPGALVEHLPSTCPSPIAMSYIVRNHKQRGRFRTAEAKRLKVPPGPLFSDLSQGLSVKSTDGNIITPDMVLEPSKEGSGIAIIDLPSKDYIPSLLQRPELTADKIMAGVGSFIWLLGPGVAQDEMLIRFMDDFKDMEHIVSSPDVCADGLVMTSAAAESLRHRQIDPCHYPLLYYNNIRPEQEASAQSKHEALFRTAKRGLKIQLEPLMAVIEDEILSDIDESSVLTETPEEVLSLAQQARNDIASELNQFELENQGLSSPDAEIVCLGTGSALPSLHRNVSATLLRVPGCGSYLLDCGENTLGQLRRMYSPTELREVLGDLRLIWISHLHADHHLGVTSVIRAWYDVVHGKSSIERPKPRTPGQMLHPENILNNERRLFMVGHPYMTRWLDEYSSAEDFGYNAVIPLNAEHKVSNTAEQCSLEWDSTEVGFNTSETPVIRSAIRKATGLSNLTYCSVSHCYGAQAVSLTFPSGFKFSYSGDCRPSKMFAKIGKGSTVLLHEATFDDEMKNDALAKKHSTISEAIGVGVAMGARRVLLTHFSQRYSRLPNLSDIDKMAVKLEDAEDVSEDPVDCMDAPVDIPAEARMPVTNSLGSPESEVRGKGAIACSDITDGDRNDGAQVSDGALNGSLSNLDMKVAVAFDYMRVKVKEIAQLGKFTPAMQELYREKNGDSVAEHYDGVSHV